MILDFERQFSRAWDELHYPQPEPEEMQPQEPEMMEPVQLAQAGQATIGPIPRTRAQEALGYVGELLTKAGVELDKYSVEIPALGRVSLKDLTVGESGKVLEDISFGFPPVRGGNVATGGIGTLGLKPEAAELLGIPLAGTAAKVGAEASVKAVKKGAKALAK